ncbi:hypothetical protein Tco_0409911, partial [Tanacetum coccineum]
ATKLGQVPVNAAKQNSPRAATSISTARAINTAAPKSRGNPQYTLQDQGIFDSGCSRHTTGNKSFLTDYQEIDAAFVAFGGSTKGVIMLEPALTRNPQQKVVNFLAKGCDEAVHKELGDRIEKAATTTSTLEAEQDSGNINRTQSMETLNELSH